MSIINSLGGGSGLDTTKLVEDLANASRTPKAALFARRTETVQAKISAVAQARSDLENFASSLSDLVAGGTLQSQPTVSDPSALSATAAAGTMATDLSGEIVIEQLARGQTVYSGYVADPTAAIGQGSFTLTVGGQAHTITVDAGNDSLNGLAAALNGSGSGVSATVVSDSAGSRLVLRGQVGGDKAFTLTTAEPALQGFSYGSGGGLTLGQSAQDARFKLDGVAYARSSNSVSDVLPGVTLTLKKATPSAAVTIASTRPTGDLKQTLQDFVGVYNTLKKDLAIARTATGSDAALRTLDRQLSTLLSTALTSNSNVRSLTDVGVSTTRDGTISLDAAKLTAALKNYPDEVEALFSPPRSATRTELTDPGIALALKQLNESATSTNGTLEGLRKRLERESEAVSKDRERMEAREAAYRTRLERQFGTLDSRISALKATQTYLEQQVKVWTNDRN